MKIIGVIGTRKRDTARAFSYVESAFLEIYEEGDVICSGLCPKGGDRFAVLLAKKYNTKTLWFPANWKRYGRAAGFIRNTGIAKSSDVLIACVSTDRKGGTEDTIKKYLKLSKDKLIIV